jgi:LPS sulfotransferase NodH
MASDVQLTGDEKLAIEHDVLERFGTSPGNASGLRQWLELPPPPRSGPSEVYDLTTAAFDREFTPPVRSLALCGTYRSGSSLVAETLQAAGGYGIPLEYFQPGAAERRYRRWLAGPEPYLDRVIGARTDPTGIFGVKLFWPDLSQLTGLDSLVPETAAGQISRVLPPPVFVWIRRRDVVAQAISALRALRFDRWRSLTTGCSPESERDSNRSASTPVPEPSEDVVSTYDFDRLYRLVGMFLHHDALWVSCLSNSAAPRVDIWYEDLAANPVQPLGQLTQRLAELGMPPQRSAPYPIRLRRQAPASAVVEVTRFLNELRDRPNR